MAAKMKIFAVETSEPYDRRFETGLGDGLGLYLSRADAQETADFFNEEFHDDSPAYVVELDVW